MDLMIAECFESCAFKAQLLLKCHGNQYLSDSYFAAVETLVRGWLQQTLYEECSRQTWSIDCKVEYPRGSETWTRSVDCAELQFLCTLTLQKMVFLLQTNYKVVLHWWLECLLLFQGTLVWFLAPMLTGWQPSIMSTTRIQHSSGLCRYNAHIHKATHIHTKF